MVVTFNVPTLGLTKHLTITKKADFFIVDQINLDGTSLEADEVLIIKRIIPAGDFQDALDEFQTVLVGENGDVHFSVIMLSVRGHQKISP